MVSHVMRFKATPEQWENKKSWNWVIHVLLDDPAERVWWILLEILGYIAIPSEIILPKTWEKIIRLVGESIKNAHDEVLVTKACQVAAFFKVSSSQHWPRFNSDTRYYGIGWSIY